MSGGDTWQPSYENAMNDRERDCDHGVTFDVEAAKLVAPGPMQTQTIRTLWPRLFGPCPKGCGFNGIAYASTAHFVYGDW